MKIKGFAHSSKPICLAALLLLTLLAVGCRTFDYTDSDLERERQQMKGNSGGSRYQPGSF